MCNVFIKFVLQLYPMVPHKVFDEIVCQMGKGSPMMIVTGKLFHFKPSDYLHSHTLTY